LTFILYSVLFLYLASACHSSIAQNWIEKRGQKFIPKRFISNIWHTDLPQLYTSSWHIPKKRLFTFDALSQTILKTLHLKEVFTSYCTVTVRITLKPCNI